MTNAMLQGKRISCARDMVFDEIKDRYVYIGFRKYNGDEFLWNFKAGLYIKRGNAGESRDYTNEDIEELLENGAITLLRA